MSGQVGSERSYRVAVEFGGEGLSCCEAGVLAPPW